MKDFPQISIIIPIYNAENYIERCAKSLMEQNFDSVEYVFIDDCSQDASVEILNSILQNYPNRTTSVKLIRHKSNQGVAISRNTGLKAAKGKYVIFCDSDDWIAPQLMQKMYATAESQNADIVMCDFYMVFNNGNKLYQVPRWQSTEKIISMQTYLEYAWNVIWNMLIRRELCLKENLWFIPNSTYCEDFNFAVKVLDKATIVTNINEPLYYYNQLNVSSAVHRLGEKAMQDEQAMYMDIISWFKKERTLDNYIKQMSWRILKSKQELVLNTATYPDFFKLFPESHAYIRTCPWINKKIKVMMWCLTHHLKFVSKAIVKLRHIKAILMK